MGVGEIHLTGFDKTTSAPTHYDAHQDQPAVYTV